MNSITNIGIKFQEVNNSVDLLQVASKLGAKLSSRGSHTYVGTCPTGHPSNSKRSFQVDTSIRKFKCWNCGIFGDASQLVEEVKGINKWESLKWLVEEYDLKIDLGQPQHSPKPTPKQIKERNVFGF